MAFDLNNFSVNLTVLETKQPSLAPLPQGGDAVLDQDDANADAGVPTAAQLAVQAQQRQKALAQGCQRGDPLLNVASTTPRKKPRWQAKTKKAPPGREPPAPTRKNPSTPAQRADTPLRAEGLPNDTESNRSSPDALSLQKTLDEGREALGDALAGGFSDVVDHHQDLDGLTAAFFALDTGDLGESINNENKVPFGNTQAQRDSGNARRADKSDASAPSREGGAAAQSFPRAADRDSIAAPVLAVSDTAQDKQAQVAQPVPADTTSDNDNDLQTPMRGRSRTADKDRSSFRTASSNLSAAASDTRVAKRDSLASDPLRDPVDPIAARPDKEQASARSETIEVTLAPEASDASDMRTSPQAPAPKATPQAARPSVRDKTGAASASSATAQAGSERTAASPMPAQTKPAASLAQAGQSAQPSAAEVKMPGAQDHGVVEAIGAEDSNSAQRKADTHAQHRALFAKSGSDKSASEPSDRTPPQPQAKSAAGDKAARTNSDKAADNTRGPDDESAGKLTEDRQEVPAEQDKSARASLFFKMPASNRAASTAMAQTNGKDEAETTDTASETSENQADSGKNAAAASDAGDTKRPNNPPVQGKGFSEHQADSSNTANAEQSKLQSPGAKQEQKLNETRESEKISTSAESLDTATTSALPKPSDSGRSANALKPQANAVAPASQRPSADAAAQTANTSSAGSEATGSEASTVRAGAKAASAPTTNALGAASVKPRETGRAPAPPSTRDSDRASGSLRQRGDASVLTDPSQLLKPVEAIDAAARKQHNASADDSASPQPSANTAAMTPKPSTSTHASDSEPLRKARATQPAASAQADGAPSSPSLGANTQGVSSNARSPLKMPPLARKPNAADPRDGRGTAESSEPVQVANGGASHTDRPSVSTSAGANHHRAHAKHEHAESPPLATPPSMATPGAASSATFAPLRGPSTRPSQSVDDTTQRHPRVAQPSKGADAGASTGTATQARANPRDTSQVHERESDVVSPWPVNVSGSPSTRTLPPRESLTVLANVAQQNVALDSDREAQLSEQETPARQAPVSGQESALTRDTSPSPQATEAPAPSKSNTRQSAQDPDGRIEVRAPSDDDAQRVAPIAAHQAPRVRITPPSAYGALQAMRISSTPPAGQPQPVLLMLAADIYRMQNARQDKVADKDVPQAGEDGVATLQAPNKKDAIHGAKNSVLGITADGVTPSASESATPPHIALRAAIMTSALQQPTRTMSMFVMADETPAVRFFVRDDAGALKPQWIQKPADPDNEDAMFSLDPWVDFAETAWTLVHGPVEPSTEVVDNTALAVSAMETLLGCPAVVQPVVWNDDARLEQAHQIYDVARDTNDPVYTPTLAITDAQVDPRDGLLPGHVYGVIAFYVEAEKPHVIVLEAPSSDGEKASFRLFDVPYSAFCRSVRALVTAFPEATPDDEEAEETSHR